MKIFAPMVLILITSLTTYAQSGPRIVDLPKQRVDILKERALRIATQLAEAVTRQEPKWKLEEDGFEGTSGFSAEGPRRLQFIKQQNWRAGEYRLEVRVQIHESADDASEMQKRESFGSSVSGPSPLAGVGDEAYILKHPYFTWIGARRGAVVVWVYGPGGGLQYTRGFINLALPLMVE